MAQVNNSENRAKRQLLSILITEEKEKTVSLWYFFTIFKLHQTVFFNNAAELRIYN